MFYSLKGQLIHTDPTTAVLECGGVGYKCTISGQTLRQLPNPGGTAMLYTLLTVREDAIDLFGFAAEDELYWFKLLCTVNGVGSKVALAILSELPPDQLMLSVAAGDTKAITRASGVGRKLAERILLELKDKVAPTENASLSAISAITNAPASTAGEAVSALTALGYSQSEAAAAVAKTNTTQPTQAIIKDALKHLF